MDKGITTPDTKVENPEMKAIAEKTEKVLTDIKATMDKKFEKFGEDYLKTTEYKLFMEKFDTAMDKIDELELKLKRPNFETKEQEWDEENEKESKAIRSWMKDSSGTYTPQKDEKGGLIIPTLVKGGGAMELKVMSSIDSSYAGYLKRPANYFGGIIKHLSEFSPVRQYANVIRTDADVKVRKRKTAAAATARAEAVAMSEDTTRTYGLETITAHEIYVEFAAYHWMIEDSAFPIEREAQSDAGEAFAVKEGSWFLSGSGVGEPEGILTAVTAGLIPHRAQGEAADITNLHALRKIPYDVNDQYINGGSPIYMMKRASVGHLVALPDAEGRYLLGDVTEPGIRRIEGFPIISATDMPAIGAGAFAALFGNFQKAYWIVDKLDITMVKDPFTHNTDGYVVFTFRKRTGGIVVQENALYALEIAAA